MASAAVLVTVGCSTTASTTASTPRPTSWPVTGLHYAPNDNFSASGRYLTNSDGFNLADVSSYAKAELDRLPAGVRGLAWLGACSGANASFRSTVGAFAGDPKLFGFYLMDEPTPSTCPPASLKAENAWIHAHVPGVKTFIILENRGTETNPTFSGSYTPENSGLDLIGLDPYPVRSGLRSPSYAEIGEYVQAAEQAGWPQSSIVPIYQAFGGGNYPNDAGGYWVLPTATQERNMLADWAALVPHPVFDYVYSWGPQAGDTSLSQSPALRAVFAAKNTDRT